MSQPSASKSSVVRGKLISTGAFSDEEWYLNACVGKNTGARDNSVGYSGGFQSATEIMLRLLGVPTPPAASECWGENALVDMLVYPICYCARHHVELVLKASLPKAWAIFKLKSPHEPQGLSEPRAREITHSVLKVWEQLHAICEKGDSRLAALTLAMHPYILDIDSIDASGQTFRYAEDAQDGTRHLDDLSHINLGFFADGYAEVSELLERLEVELDVVRAEMIVGAYTVKLNREQLHEFANRLPKFQEWTQPSFEEVKAAVCKDYGLSSNDFQKACEMVKASRTLSWRIDLFQPIKWLSKDSFLKLKTAHQSGITGKDSLTLEERSSVLGLIRVGSRMYLPEEFDSFVTDVPADSEALGAFKQEREEGYLARKVAGRPDIIQFGLRILGQQELLEAFGAIYKDELDRLAAQPGENKRKLEQFKKSRSEKAKGPDEGSSAQR